MILLAFGVHSQSLGLTLNHTAKSKDFIFLGAASADGSDFGGASSVALGAPLEQAISNPRREHTNHLFDMCIDLICGLSVCEKCLWCTWYPIL